MSFVAHVHGGGRGSFDESLTCGIVDGTLGRSLVMQRSAQHEPQSPRSVGLRRFLIRMHVEALVCRNVKQTGELVSERL